MRTRRYLGSRQRFILLVVLAVTSRPSAAGPAKKLPTSPLRRALETELARTMDGLASKPVPPYYLAYAVYETETSRLGAAFGAATQDATSRRRLLSIDLRVGDRTFDNTHAMRGDFGSRFSSMREAVEVPLDDDADAVRSIVWRETERRYRQAVEALAKVKSNRAVKVEEEDKSADFSVEDPVIDSEPPAVISFDRDAWRAKLKRCSAVFAGDPHLLEGQATFEVTTVRRTLVSSEGTRIETSQTSARLALYAMTKAEDGMELPRFETFQAFRPQDLPPEDRLLADAQHMVADLLALRAAPTLDPYTGPAILSGRSAGVFFHEIFGHRIEGHRQKDEEGAQTFKKMIGEKVLPDFLSVVFDPTRRTIGTTPAAGYYRYDDQGIPARPVRAVDAGVFRSFLMSRSPITGFPTSNGHGRCQPGFEPVGRQSNLIVEASRPVPAARLRDMLREEVRKQGKEFGLLFEDIAGGFTFTGRTVPNAFAVQPVMVWRIYADGRPNELVRGADLIGTPLTTFSKILAAGDDLQTFNGVCGAESGWVPVSASSPSLLLGQIEVQKKAKSSERLPILPPPSPGGERSLGEVEP
jgi:predicted Zn-dependent protease